MSSQFSFFLFGPAAITLNDRQCRIVTCNNQVQMSCVLRAYLGRASLIINLPYMYVYDAGRPSHSPLPTILPLIPHFPLMSHTHPASTSSNFQLIFDNALKAYQKWTNNDLLTHPLADRFEACDSARSMLTMLQEQVQELNRSQRSNTKWLNSTVNVISAFSETLGEGVGSVRFRT